MKGLNLDFKKIAVETAGNAAGLVLVTQVNRIGFIKNIQKPILKGLAMIALAKIALPFAADKLMGKGKGAAANFVNGASEAMSTYGVGYIMANTDATKAMVPAIQGVGGYEDNPYLGVVYEDEPGSVGTTEEQMNGYEENVYD